MWRADEIAQLCYDRFRDLPKRGKPEIGREWTLLAAVVKITRGQDMAEKEVVSLGTGTKCIGRSAMSPSGDVLNDSHAEIVARRGYLTEHLGRAVRGEKSSVFCPADDEGKWRVQPGVSFLFFTSHTPCGDASIVPEADAQSQPCLVVRAEKDTKEKSGPSENGLKRRSDRQPDGSDKRFKGEPGEGEKKKEVLEGAEKVVGSHAHLSLEKDSQTGQRQDPATLGAADLHRTGAKCVPGGTPDPLEPGLGYHSVGVLRVKPGRGEPTLSLSCSDKMARWTVLGFQGALLIHYLQSAVYFEAVITGKCPYSPDAMKRALCSRCCHVTGLPTGFAVRPPELFQSGLEFCHSLSQTQLSHHSSKGRVSPCGAAISWSAVPNQPVDVTATGYKHGVTKKALGTAQARSLISKVELFRSFQALLKATPVAQIPPSLRDAALQTYWDYKRAARDYQLAWLCVRTQAFPLWPQSPRELLHFK
ncbi:tRNA-specific adenosine deaminase 1 isoform X2 [Denticeps clupeoides]|uniref:tRNA-specific adenosine deaminase 1 isoform X2 n=1 Tax=Denticeps clupeoides TaxID=299321 RepID=UPI0010A31764|nr:tRNA-specific adenosine deaminase 1 isoform X2 [Denticeps clupeoides]